MAFWGSDLIKEQMALNNIIDPYDQNQVKYGRYQLKVGSEIFISVDDVKKNINHNEMVSIDPGQFAIILSEETVSIPEDVIAFISIRSGKKLRGLVNVSGFHVDPGFSGKLKFAVYNAGARPIALTRGEPAFLIWFSELSNNNDAYDGNHNKQSRISSEDVDNLHGKLASPSALNNRIDELRKDFERIIGDTKLDCNSSINELRANHDSQIESLKDKVNLWRGLVISLIVAVIIMALKLLFDGSTAQKNNSNNMLHSQISGEISKQVNEAMMEIKADKNNSYQKAQTK